MNSLKELVKNPATVIVDVRSQWEYETGHIPGAKNIPLEEMSVRLAEFKILQQPIVLYCQSGNRSGIAASILKQNGVTDVYNGGGLADIQFLLN